MIQRRLQQIDSLNLSFLPPVIGLRLKRTGRILHKKRYAQIDESKERIKMFSEFSSQRAGNHRKALGCRKVYLSQPSEFL